MKNAGKSPHTVRGYRSDLLQFVAHHDGDIGEPAAAPIRAYLADVTKALNTFCSRRPRKDVPLDRLRDRVLFASSPT